MKKSKLSSEKGLRKVLECQRWNEIEEIELEIIIEQIRYLKLSIKKLDTAIEQEAGKLKGYRNLVSMSGIRSLSAGILLSAIGDIEDFTEADKLASYFGIVPRVTNSADTVKHKKPFYLYSFSIVRELQIQPIRSNTEGSRREEAK